MQTPAAALAACFVAAAIEPLLAVAEVPDATLLSALAGLTAAIGILWRQLQKERQDAEADRKQASRLIFALLQERATRMGEKPPTTQSTPDKPHFGEAVAIAAKTLNGDTERLIKAYLESEPPA